MDIKNYMDIMKFVFNSQIECAKEELEKPGADEMYLAGIIRGLQIAQEKIDASMFLAKN